MADRESLVIEFNLAESGDVSPAEFRYLFTAVDEITRSLVFEQMRAFVAMADISDRARYEIYDSMFRVGPILAPPVHVISIRRESPWSVLIGIPVASIIWFLRKMIAPEVLQAWSESQLRDNFKRFMRDVVFQGAKTQVEASPAVRAQFGNLVVDKISEGRRSQGERPAVLVTLRRSEILKVELKDRELMNEFLAKIGIKSE
jgi:hypothetical protein